MTTLRSLPIDLLALILDDWFVSPGVLSLWKCGDSLLNSKLARSITKVDLKHCTSLGGNYPRLLSNLSNLRHLSISASYRFRGYSSNGFSELGKLSKSLKSLSIHSANLTDLPLNPSASFTNKVRFFDVASLFPSLLSLTVHQQGDIQNQIVLTHSYELPSLPSTLTYLSWGDIEVTVHAPKLMSLLPRTLTTLDAAVTVRCGFGETPLPPSIRDDWSQAPSGLSTIAKISVWPSADNYSWLPKSLTSCRLEQVFASREELRSLPRLGIKEVCVELGPQLEAIPGVQAMDKSWALDLPPRLESLVVHPMDQTELLPTDCASLPASLTSLRLESFYVDWTLFISTIESLATSRLSSDGDASEMKRYTEAVTNFWPKELTTFQWISTSQNTFGMQEGTPFELSPKMVALLPRSLTNLTIERYRPLDAPSDDDEDKTLFFPPLLTWLKMNEDDNVWTDVEIDLRSLTHLRGFELTAPAETAFFVPSCLTSLDIENITVERLANLPASLTHLKIYWIYGPTSESISEAILALPTSLRSLVVTQLPFGNSPLELSPNTFSTLTQLESLDFATDSHTFQVAVLKELFQHNKRLKKLRLKIHALEREFVQYIPPQLIQLNLYCKIDWAMPDLEQHWPPYCTQMASMPASFLAAMHRRARDALYETPSV